MALGSQRSSPTRTIHGPNTYQVSRMIPCDYEPTSQLSYPASQVVNRWSINRVDWGRRPWLLLLQIVSNIADHNETMDTFHTTVRTRIIFIYNGKESAWKNKEWWYRVLICTHRNGFILFVDVLGGYELGPWLRTLDLPSQPGHLSAQNSSWGPPPALLLRVVLTPGFWAPPGHLDIPWCKVTMPARRSFHRWWYPKSSQMFMFNRELLENITIDGRPIYDVFMR